MQIHFYQLSIIFIVMLSINGCFGKYLLKSAAFPPYKEVLHLQIQSTSNGKQYFPFRGREFAEIQLFALFCTISHKGLEHSWFFVSKEILEPKPHRYQQTSILLACYLMLSRLRQLKDRHIGMILVCASSAEVCNFQEHSMSANSVVYSSAQPELSLNFISSVPVRLNQFLLIPRYNLLAVRQCLKDIFIYFFDFF